MQIGAVSFYLVDNTFLMTVTNKWFQLLKGILTIQCFETVGIPKYCNLATRTPFFDWRNGKRFFNLLTTKQFLDPNWEPSWKWLVQNNPLENQLIVNAREEQQVIIRELVVVLRRGCTHQDCQILSLFQLLIQIVHEGFIENRTFSQIITNPKMDPIPMNQKNFNLHLPIVIKQQKN